MISVNHFCFKNNNVPKIKSIIDVYSKKILAKADSQSIVNKILLMNNISGLLFMSRGFFKLCGPLFFYQPHPCLF